MARQKVPEIPAELLGDWDNLKLPVSVHLENHKFFDRTRTMQINWARLHSLIPDLLSRPKMKCLDIGCGNGATLEILRWYGHEVVGMDFSASMENDWKYKSLIESQGLNCVCHSGSNIPYPFDDKEFDLVICYGAITFFPPVSIWPKVLNEFARIAKSDILLGVNVGKIFDEGKHYIDNWKHDDFQLDWNRDHLYRYKSTKA